MEQYAVRLDVIMDVAETVDGSEGFQDASQGLQKFLLTDVWTATRLQCRLQVACVHQLRHEVDVGVLFDSLDKLLDAS